MSKLKEFLARKDIVISPQRYLIDALGAMAQGLFASLLIGTIIKTAITRQTMRTTSLCFCWFIEIDLLQAVRPKA